MSSPTARPWFVQTPRPGDGGAGPHDRVITGRHVEDADGSSCVVVAHVKGNATAGDTPQANADLIVRAVNAHHQLVFAVEEAIRLLDAERLVSPSGMLVPGAQAVYARCRQALKEAKGA